MSVSEYVWVNTTRNGGWVNYSSGAQSPATYTSGNVTAGEVEASNWTVVELQNKSVAGPGLSTPCAASFVALHGSPWEWMAGLSSPMATHLENDRALPTSLNSRSLWYFWTHSSLGAGWNPPACPESSTFDLNFTSASGVVNTCGQPSPAVQTAHGSALHVSIPFTWNGRALDVPAAVSLNAREFSTWGYPGLASFGTSLTSTHTFPAGGIWSYDTLASGSPDGSGLVFSYSSCPA